MAANFDDFILWPAREVVLLSELTPGFVLDGFTQVTGTPRVWKISLPKFVQTDLFKGGIFRKCVGVQADATALTERANLVAVNNTPGNWWWDHENGLLYVRTSDGVSDYDGPVLADSPAAYWRLDEVGSYGNQALAGTPAGYWRLQETSGTLADASGNGRTGTASGSPTYAQASPLVASAAKSMLFLPGGGSYISVGATGFDLTGSFTLSAWVYLTNGAFDGATNWHIFKNDTANVKGAKLQVGGANGKVTLRTNQAGALTEVTTDTVLAFSTWYHIVATFDGTTGRIYINGALDKSGALTAAVTTADAMTISANGQGMVGRMAEPAIYNGRAMAAAEIAALYTARLSASNLSTAQATDASTNNSHGTHEGGPILAQSAEVMDGTAATFTGVDACRVKIDASAHALETITAAVTIEAWVRLDTAAFPNSSRMYFSGSSASSYCAVYILSGGVPKALCSLFIGGVQRSLVLPTVLAADTWYHLVFTWANGDQIRGYINGVFVDGSGSSYSGTLDMGSGTYYIGKYSADTLRPWSGKIDEVAVYPTQLSATRIAAHYAGASVSPDTYAMQALVTFYVATKGMVLTPDSHPAVIMAQSPTIYWRLDEAGSIGNQLLAGTPSGYWRLKEASGTLADSSGNGRTGTLIGAGTYQKASPMADPTALALQLRSNGYLDVGAAGFDLTGSFTLSAWVYLNDAVYDAGGYTVFTNETLNVKGVQLRIDGSAGAVVLRTNQAAANTSVQTDVTDVVPLQTWTHILATFDGTNGRIYLNGVLVKSGALTAAVTTADPMTIGAASGSLDGQLAEPAIYNGRAMAAAEIAAIYAARLSTSSAMSNQVADTSGNNGYGTFAGGPLLGQSSDVPTGTAVTFTGIDACRVTIDTAQHALEEITAGVTIEAWVQLDTVSLPNTYRMIFSGSQSGSYLGIYDSGGPRFLFSIMIGGVQRSLSIVPPATGLLAAGIWYHVACTWTNGGTIKGYMNGALVSESAAYTGTLDLGSGTAYIGKYSASGLYPWSGKIDEVAIYPFALTAGQVEAHALRAAVYYHPWMTPDQVPVTDEQVEDVLFGVKYQASGSVTFTNGHRFFDKLLATVGGTYVWKNHAIRFLMGGSYNGLTLPYPQYNIITTMLINDWAANQLVANFSLKAKTKQLDKTIPVTPYFESDHNDLLESQYMNLGAGVRGTHKWIGYGRATMKPDLTDTSGNGVYTVADADYQTLFAVNAVYAVEKTTGDRILLTLTTDYTVDLTLCTITVVNPVYIHNDFDLEADVSGKPDGLGSYLKTFGQITKDILTTFLAVPVSQIDTASFTQADVDDDSELSVWLKSPRQIASIFSGAGEDQPCLEKSVLGTISQTTAGLWECRIFSPIVDATDPNVITMRQSDFGTFEPQPKVESMYGLTRVYFNRNQYDGDFDVTEYEDSHASYLNDLPDDPAKIYTFLRSEVDAQRLAQRYQLISGSASTSIQFSERGLKLIKAKAGQKVLVTYDPAPSPTGAWDSEPFEITALSKVSGPVPAVSGELGDLKGIGNRIGRWMSSGAPDYSAATTAQRAAGGYWANTDGTIVAGDVTTKNIKVWY